MILVVDIGNTATKLGLYDGPSLVVRRRIPTDPRRPASQTIAHLHEVAREAGQSEISGSAIASVVPSATAPMRTAIVRAYDCSAIMLGAMNSGGLELTVETPESLGPDRIANAIGAAHFVGMPAIAINMGSATTFTVVDAHARLVGGAIAPGLGMARDALAERTGRLPRVELTEPGSAVGRDTTPAIQAGLVYGFAGLVSGLLTRIRAEIGANVRVAATGGWSSTLAPLVDGIDIVHPDLTLTGLRLAYEHAQAHPRQSAPHLPTDPA